MAKEKAVKCYHCGETIEFENQLVEKKIPMSTKAGIRNYRRKFHMDCLSQYLEGREDKELMNEENEEWCKVYDYFKEEILGIKRGIKLKDQHLVRRLLGLRVGKYYPEMNTRVVKRGYDFDVILLTLKVIKPKVAHYLSTTNFANNKHKIDGIMRFVTGEIDDVYTRVERQKKANEKLERVEVPVIPQGNDYTSHLKRNENKKEIKTKIDTGGLL